MQVEQLLQEAGSRLCRQLGQPVKGLEDLAEQKRKVLEIREAARQIADHLNDACTAPLDTEQVTQAEAAANAGRFKKGKELIAQLRSAGGA
jgi:translation initiation factor 2 alpha subunit (eIF-2alpha)